MRAGHRVLVGHVAEARKLPRLAGMRPRGDPRPGTAVAHLFAVHVDAFQRALALMPEGALLREIAGAMTLPDRRARHVFLGRGIPQEHLVGRRREVLALQHLEGPAIDLPPRDEGALRTVGARDAGGRGELVIHDQREIVTVVVESAQPIRDPDHPVAVDRVADGQDRHRAHARQGREQVRLRRRAGRQALVGQGSRRLQQRGADEHEGRRRHGAFQE